MTEAPLSPPRRERAGVSVLFTVLGLTLLGYLLHRTGWRQLGDALEKLGLEGAIVLGIIGFAENSLDGAALYRALLGHVGLGWALASNNIGALVNLAVPLEAGEVFKAMMLRQRSKESRVLSGLVIWNYVWRVSRPSAGLVTCLLAFMWGASFGALEQLVFVAAMAAFVPYLLLRLVVRGGKPAERLMRLASRIPVLRRSASRRLSGATKLDGEVHRFWGEHRRAFVTVFIMQFAARAAAIVAWVGTLGYMGLALPLHQALLIYVALSGASDLILALLPAKVGLNEAAALVMFQLFGLDPAAGLLAGVMVRMRTFGAQLLFGPLLVAALRIRARLR